MRASAQARKSGDTFNALDPSLPFIAARAALELDNLLLGSSNTLDFVEQLTALLFISSSAPSAADNKVLDPVSSNVLTRAFSESFHNELHSFSDLSNATSRLSQQLKGILENPTTEKDQIGELRNFFIAISRLASSSRTSIYGEQRVHPYRK